MKSKVHKYVPVATHIETTCFYCFFFKKTKYLNADKEIFFCQ